MNDSVARIARGEQDLQIRPERLSGIGELTAIGAAGETDVCKQQNDLWMLSKGLNGSGR
jgi:hypothetical protein